MKKLIVIALLLSACSDTLDKPIDQPACVGDAGTQPEQCDEAQ